VTLDIRGTQPEPELLRQAWYDVSRRARVGLPAYVGIGALAAWNQGVPWEHARWAWTLTAVLAGLAIFRAMLIWRFQEWWSRNPESWILAFRGATVGTALALASTIGARLAATGFDPQVNLLLLASGAFGSMSLVTYAPDRWLQVCYSPAFAAPLLCVLLPMPETWARALSLCMAAFLFYCFLHGRHLHATYWRAAGREQLVLRHAQELEQMQAQLRHAYAELEVRVELRTAELNAVNSALRARQEDYRRIFEGAHDAILIFEPRDERVLAVNARACELYGFTSAEFTGLSLHSISKDRRKGELEVARTLIEGAHHNFETVQYRKDGSEIELEVNASVIDYQGRPAILSMNRDVTERNRSQQLRLAKEAAERSNHAKSQFLATISHELRTPLASIHGALALIRGGAASEPRDTAELLELATRNCDRLLHLVNDILDLQKVEAGQLTFRWKPAALVTLVADAVTAMAPHARQCDVTLDLCVPEDAARYQVWVDTERVIQVCTNLLGNALKFSPPGGRVQIAFEELAEHVRVSVSDSGPGVPADFRARLFDKFAQADTSDARRRGGSGLGLSIARALVKNMGGEIAYAARPEGGATFYFDLPLWTGRGFASKAAPAALPGVGPSDQPPEGTLLP
jgi:PAS domain S-box-containing protein